MTRYALLFAAAAALFVARPASAEPIMGGKLYAEGKDVTVEVQAPNADYKSEIWLLTPGFETLIGLNTDVGATKTITGIPEMTELIFGIHVLKTNYWFVTGPGVANRDKLAHATVDWQAQSRAVLGFEDLYYGGDKDYNDAMFQVDGASPTPHAPEPASLAMFGAAAAAAVVWRRRRQK